MHVCLTFSVCPLGKLPASTACYEHTQLAPLQVSGRMLKYVAQAGRVSQFIASKLQSSIAKNMLFPSCSDLKLPHLLPADDPAAALALPGFLDAMQGTANLSLCHSSPRIWGLDVILAVIKCCYIACFSQSRFTVPRLPPPQGTCPLATPPLTQAFCAEVLEGYCCAIHTSAECRPRQPVSQSHRRSNYYTFFLQLPNRRASR